MPTCARCTQVPKLHRKTGGKGLRKRCGAARFGLAVTSGSPEAGRLKKYFTIVAYRRPPQGSSRDAAPALPVESIVTRMQQSSRKWPEKAVMRAITGIDLRRVAVPSCRHRDRGRGVGRQTVAGEKAAYGLLGDTDEAAIEQLQNVGEGRPVAAVLRHDQMRRFVQHQEAVEIALLDGDPMVGDVGEAADSGIVEAGNERELRRHAAAGDEDIAQHLGCRVVVDEPMPGGKRGEEI